MAAFEVAKGDYANFAHRYIAVGRARGYRPLPEVGEPWWDWRSFRERLRGFRIG